MPYLKGIYDKIRNMASKSDLEAFKKDLDEIDNLIKSNYQELVELKYRIKGIDGNGRNFEEFNRKIAALEADIPYLKDIYAKIRNMAS